ncbi:NUDIX domain-containing protein [Leifsonia sp. 71-9]|uniref:NUDIX domain-containing protein n=1 Tax=Leifsonia sp. 71-9 TaxID=1895934 RepID=UPI0025C3BBD9|nr:NUDIX domain-containing protein [Leifsonia sp. 71-9]
MNHFGVYGVWRQDGRVVAIRKARGPYTGLLDLPGGTPEAGESPVQTLRRELQEECGVGRVAVLSWHGFEFDFEESSSGERVDGTHRGLIAVVDVADGVAAIEDFEDVAAVELIDPRDTPVTEFTPPFRYALALLDGQ